MQQFFVICPIGFESLVEKEIQLKWSMLSESNPPDFKYLDGGLEFACPLEIGLALNKILRTASRILMRVHSQICRDLPKLYQILKKIEWSHYLQQKNIHLKVSSSRSRLLHTKKIKETAQKSIQDFFNGHPLSQYAQNQEYPGQAIYLRIEDDELTVSLDTTGAHLHKRIDYRGKASIRENIAATLLLALTEGDFSKNLCDPMCGSGTFLQEYQNFFTPLNREFSFNNWKRIKLPKLKMLEQTTGKVFGFDKDPNIVKKLSLKYVQTADFFKHQIKTDFLILNPPYGKRIKIKGDKQQYFDQIIQKIKKDQVQKAGVIVPSIFAKKYKQNSLLHFNQNGIKVDFLVFEF